MLDTITKLLVAAGVTWWPKKKAQFLLNNDVVKVVRCKKCKYRSEYNTIDGILYYCNVHECITPHNGYCHSGEAGEAVRSVTGD